MNLAGAGAHQSVAVYLDLDGVLADYEAKVRAMGFDCRGLNVPSNRLAAEDRERKARIQDAIIFSDFYRRLPLLADAEQLYMAVAPLKPVILTAAPRFGFSDDQSDAFRHAALMKRIWCREQLGLADDSRFICTTSDRKHHYIGRMPGSLQVLIDDRHDNVERWRASGGIAVLHTSAAESISAFNKILGPDGPAPLPAVACRHGL